MNETADGGRRLESERAPSEDAADYMVFALGEGQPGGAAAHVRPRLDQVRKAATKMARDLTREYIWQRDAFSLELASENHLLHLRGRTSYGDCVEDEWLVVYILREISKSFPDVWVRIADGDGEFLLIEAAKAVPKWLNPEMDAYRVWIHNGQLKIIPVDAVPGKSSLDLADAIQAIKAAPDRLVHLPDLEKEAFYRLEKYPGQVAASMYHTRLLLPRKIAFILHDRPRAIAPAVEAFVFRDPVTTKRVYGADNAQLRFPPSDLVHVSTKFTRVLYAQLRGQRFTPPVSWPSAYGAFYEEHIARNAGASKGKEPEATSADQDGEKLQAMLEVSMKLACGFELIMSAAEQSNNRIVHEVSMILDDLAEDEERGLELPSDKEILSWKDVAREDEDAWLNINLDDFERELDSTKKETPEDTDTPASSSKAKAKPAPPTKGMGFGDVGVQTDLRHIVSQFQAFLNDNDAGIEGAEFDEMDEDDDDNKSDDEQEEGNEVRFDEEEFSRLMREMLGMPPAAASSQASSQMAPQTAVSMPEKAAKSTVPAGDKNDEDGILELAAQFEAELKSHGALKIDGPKKASTPKGFEAAKVNDDDDSDGEDGEVDIDFNLAKNLLESFKSQEGEAGPAGNILSMLGMALPRDKDVDGDGDDA